MTQNIACNDAHLITSVDGVTIAMHDFGGTGSPVLLSHATGFHAHCWEPVAHALNSHHHVVGLDHRGYGDAETVNPATMTWDQYGLDALAAARDLYANHDEPIIGIGHSMGGKMAWSLAASQPDRVKALVLMAPDGFPEAKDIGSKPYEVPAIMGLIQYFLPKYFVQKSIEPAFADPQTLNEALVNRYYDMLRAPGVRGAILDRSNQTIYTDPVPRLKKIKAPTLLLWGEQDQMIPSSNAQSYAGVLLNSSTIVVPKLGHLLQEEQPDIGLAALKQFLETHQAAIKP